LGGHDIDDKVDTTVVEEITVTNAGPTVSESEPKKKPGRPKGSTAKKTPSKKTPSKKTPSKKI
jgi:topoisomerase IA-like protein